jgi:hypothetical protein
MAMSVDDLNRRLCFKGEQLAVGNSDGGFSAEVMFSFGSDFIIVFLVIGYSTPSSHLC